MDEWFAQSAPKICLAFSISSGSLQDGYVRGCRNCSVQAGLTHTLTLTPHTHKQRGGLSGRFPPSAMSFYGAPVSPEQEVSMSWVTVQTHTINSNRLTSVLFWFFFGVGVFPNIRGVWFMCEALCLIILGLAITSLLSLFCAYFDSFRLLEFVFECTVTVSYSNL